MAKISAWSYMNPPLMALSLERGLNGLEAQVFYVYCFSLRFTHNTLHFVSRDNAVGIATGYGLDD
jgi:hypothetical protein